MFGGLTQPGLPQGLQSLSGAGIQSQLEGSGGRQVCKEQWGSTELRGHRACWHKEGKLTSSPWLLLPLPAFPDGNGSETGCTKETGSLEAWGTALLARENLGGSWVGGEWFMPSREFQREHGRVPFDSS